MAIARTGTANQAATAQTSASVVRPTGAGTGDVLVMLVTAELTPATFSTPAGWTKLSQTDGATFSTGLYWRIDDGGAGPYAVTWDGVSRLAWWRNTSYSGANTVNTQASQANASSATVTAPTITPTVNDCMLLGLFSPDGPASATWTPPTSYTAFDDTANTVFASQRQLTGGSGSPTGAITGTISAAASNSGHHLALAPTGGGWASVRSLRGFGT